MMSDDTTAEPLADPPVLDEIGEQFGEDVGAELSEIWTVISRGWHSNFFTLDEEYPPAMLDVYVDREHLTDGEREDLKLFTGELGSLRPESRSDFASLTAIEHSILRVLRRGARRKLNDQEDTE